MNWKIIGPSALINAALTIVLSLLYFPLSFLGPFIGGFLSSYLSKGFEDYEGMEKNDGAVVGAISGLVGGLIIGLVFLLGFGDINAKIGVIVGGNVLITGYVVFELSVFISFILGLIGGIIGVVVKK